jgi:alpha-beta hydrolase superfamily lysophospholipase
MRFLATALVVAAVAAATGCKLDSIVFDPLKESEYRFSPTVVPDSLRTEINFPSARETLYGVRLRRPGNAPRLTVLLSHGKGGNITRDLEWKRAEAIWQAGYDVIAYDYRGYGKSTGSSTGEATLLTDARAALAYTLALPGTSAQSLVLYGHSLGGVPTTELAASVSRASGGVRGVVLESAFASGEAMAHSATLLDVPGEWLIDGKFDNVGKLRDIDAPILILAGSDDIQIPRATEQLRARAKDPSD